MESSPPDVPDFRSLRIAVRHHRTLPAAAKLLFEDVCDLAEKSGACTASDTHFAAVYEVDKRSVRRWIGDLRDAGFVVSEGATRNRKLVPADPSLRTPSVLGLRRPTVLSGADLGHSDAPDLGHSQDDTKSISSSLRERGIQGGVGDSAEAVSDDSNAAVRAYLETTGLPLAFIHRDLIARRFPEPIAEADLRDWTALVATWHATPNWNARNVGQMLRAYDDERKRSEDRPASKAPRTGTRRNLADL